MKPRVSVIMPAYNAALYIREAIESILNQSFSNFELIVINDGSTDNTLQCIQSFADKRIKLIDNKKNLGIIRSRNIGLKAATGEYIAKMDADDISLPKRLQRQVTYLDQHLDVAVLATKLVLMDEHGELTGVWPEDYYIGSAEQIKHTLPRTNCIGQPTVMMRARVIENLAYNEKYLHNEDWGFWLDLISKGEKIEKLNEVLLHYRVHASSTTVTANAKNIARKTIKFKWRYLVQNMASPNWLWWAVLKGLISDLLKSGSPEFLLRGLRVLKIGPLLLLRTYMQVRREIGRAEASLRHLFFFPYYHSGGAEKVHAAILNTLSDRCALVVITGQSSNKALLQEFSKHARLVEVEPLLKFGPGERWLKAKLNSLAKRQPSLVCFGCNSRFYYHWLSQLPTDNKAIDLTHAFVHEYEDGPEKWSLPVVNRLSNRIVISENTIQDFQKIYQKHGLDLNYLNRLQCITNFVHIPPFEHKPAAASLRVLYVGRGSVEKRIHLISAAARFCAEKQLPVNFHFAGDTDAFIPESDKAFCVQHGEIFDETKLNALYKHSDVLIVASSREGFPMVIMEAMAHGVVPVSTAVGGIPSLIQSGSNGILIQETDETKIVLAIVSQLEEFLKNRTELDTLSRQAYDYASQHFRKENFEAAYRKLLNNQYLD